MPPTPPCRSRAAARSKRRQLVLALLLAAVAPLARALPTLHVEGTRRVVEGANYRLGVTDGTADLTLELRRPGGAWEAVTTSPSSLSFGLLGADAAQISNGLPVAWAQGQAGEALALAGRMVLDPAGGTILAVHLLCAVDGLLIGARLEGEGGGQAALWAPPRLTLAPAAWEGYAFWSQDGRYHAGRLADLDPVPAYAGVSPWGSQGDTSPALAAQFPGLLVRSAAREVGLGVVPVDAAGTWQGSSFFLQRHSRNALFFYAGYTPRAAAGDPLRWAWLAPFPPGAAAADAARVTALLAQAAGLLAVYQPLTPAIPAGAEPVPEFPASLRRTAPVAEVGEAVVYTVNEDTHAAYGLDLARKAGSEVMIRAWFKWGQAPAVAKLTAIPAQAHGCGALFGGGITCSALYDNENGLTPEQVLDMATRGPDGALVDAWDQPGLRHGSLSSPAYLEYLFRWCREQIDAGVDYLFMDEHTAALSEREGYDDHSLADFRRYLLEVSPTTRGWTADDPRWRTRLGIDAADRAICPAGTLASFDYRAYLKAGDRLAQPQGEGNPLAPAWGDFRAWRDDQAWKALTERIRSYAAARGRRILISANGIAPYVDLQVLGVWGQWTTRNGHIDLAEDLLPRWRSLVVQGRQAVGGRPVPVVLFHDWGFGDTPFPWLAVPPAEREVWMRTRGAEIYAAGAFFAFPLLGPFGCDAGRDGTLRTIARQTAFYAAHRELYLQQRWLGHDRLVSAVPNLSLGATWWAPAKTLVVHVINREVRAGVLHPVSAPVVIRLPVTPGPSSAVVISPDAEGEATAACRAGATDLEVTLPELQAYSVVLLRYAKEPDLAAVTDPARVWLQKRWARPARADFRVLPGGVVEFGEALEGFMQGTLHGHLRQPPVFSLHALGPAELRLRVRAVASAGARLTVRLDAGPPEVVDLPDLDGKNSDGPEYDRTLTFPIPAGEHRVALDNVGGDWLVLDWLEFSGTFAEPAAVAAAPAWSVLSLRKAEDRVEVASAGPEDLLTVVSPSGIGAAELAFPERGEVRAVRVRLLYAEGKPFPRLEGFDAATGLLGATTAAKLEPRQVSVAGGVEVILELPAGSRGAAALRLAWVDAYR